MAIEDKFDHIKQSLHMGGKQKGYLLYDDNGEVQPSEAATALDDVDDLLTTFGGAGMEVIEGGTKLGEDKLDFDKKLDETGEELELDLTPGSLDKTNDPVRMYLREMGTVPLLTREGEVEIAKRIERGQNNVLKAMFRCPIVIREVQKLGEELKSEGLGPSRGWWSSMTTNSPTSGSRRGWKRSSGPWTRATSCTRRVASCGRSWPWFPRASGRAISRRYRFCAGQGGDPHLPQDPFHRVHPLGTQAPA